MICSEEYIEAVRKVCHFLSTPCIFWLSFGVFVLALLFVFAVFILPVIAVKVILVRRKTDVPLSLSEEEKERLWIETKNSEIVQIRSADGLLLNGYYLGAGGASGGDMAIIAHGYRGEAKQMGRYARFFYEALGFSVLLPDARAHGKSQGTYIGFGWPERLDYLRWIDLALKRGAGRIVLFGVSMGAATVMMASGEKLPPQVKAIIEDCGYTSAFEQICHVIGRKYHIKGDWLTRKSSKAAKKNAGYSFEEASAVEQLKKTKVPVLFIHGEEDQFVPFPMVQTLYDACASEKELYTVKGAGHGFSYEVASGEYENRIRQFIKKHLP
ncbi:MAG: alpha/beta hydrolase [Treponema sp.]|jgi:fermentation-respiration switch protein FrsA (DUF1100 family)|nr:alpha/beta hydrolase [Treponema sp.]